MPCGTRLDPDHDNGHGSGPQHAPGLLSTRRAESGWPVVLRAVAEAAQHKPNVQRVDKAIQVGIGGVARGIARTHRTTYSG